jgi:AcrR family transcriptional regulator
MNKKERLTEYNRTRIIATAKALFLEKGIVQTTMDEIAKKADYSKSTVYVYFKSKEEIYDCIVLEHLVILRDGLESALNNATDFPEGFYALCNTVARFYKDYPMYFDGILGEIEVAADESDSLRYEIYLVGEQINGLVKDYIKFCIAMGQVRADLSDQSIFALWAGICGIVTLAYKKERYINIKMNADIHGFMQNGFTLLLRSILPPRVVRE